MTAVDRSADVQELEALGATPVVADITDESERLAHRCRRGQSSRSGQRGRDHPRGGDRCGHQSRTGRTCSRSNVEALFFLTQRLLPMIPRGGSIVNVSSMAAKVGDDASAAYSATKAAVASVTRSLAVGLGPQGDPRELDLAGDHPDAHAG